MPRYEYKCRFGHTHEQERPVDSRDAPATCSVNVDDIEGLPRFPCGAPLKRVFVAPGISMEGRAYKEYGGDINDRLAST